MTKSWVIRSRNALLASLVFLLGSCGGGGGDGGVPVTMTLTATVMSGSRIDVNWTPATGSPTYGLYANGSRLGAIDGTYWPVTALAASTRYCFIVYAAYFPFGTLYRSNEDCVTTMADLPPAAPTGVSATVLSPARIDLAWIAATDDWGIASYRIDRDTTQLATVTGLAHTDASVNPVTTYCYTVTAIDSAGNSSPPSAPACATTLGDSEAPTAPSGLSATADGENVTLRWAASTDNGAVASYLIYRDGALAQTMPAPAGTGTVQATDPMLARFDQYCYQVIARDRANNDSPPSNRACTTTSWQHGVLVAGAIMSHSAGERNALAIDATGALHIGYSLQSWRPATLDYGPAQLRYASNTGGAWSDLQITPIFSALYRISVAADSSARAHLAFVDSGNAFPMYAQPSGAWQVERIAQESAHGVSLALDANGDPRVAYGRQTLHYASKASGVWSVTDVPNTPSDRPAFALDVGGRAHIAFVDSASLTLRYASDTSGAWVTATIEATNAGYWHFVALAVDTAAAAHVSYVDGTTLDLKYATNRTGAWVTATVDSDGNVGYSSSIAVDGAGAAHVSYVDATNGRLKYATNASGTWQSFELAPAGIGSIGWGDTSIAVERSGRIHIVYFWGGGLYYVTRP